MALELDSNILPWIEANTIYTDYPTLTWRRVIIIVSSTIFFKLIQLMFIHVIGLQPRRAFKAVSLTHSCIAVSASFYVLTTYHSLFAYTTSTCAPIQYADYVCSFSFGYFVYDLYKTITQEPGLDFIAHGTLCILIYGIVIHTAAGQAIGLSVLLYEASTIFLHSYAFLHYAHYNYLASIMRFVFAFLFFMIRIVYGSYVTIQLLHAYVLKPDSIEWNCCAPWKYWSAVGINLAFHCLNMHWFRLIVNKALKVWRQGKENAFEKPGEELEFDKRREDQKKSFAASKGKED